MYRHTTEISIRNQNYNKVSGNLFSGERSCFQFVENTPVKFNKAKGKNTRYTCMGVGIKENQTWALALVLLFWCIPFRGRKLSVT